MWATSGPWYGNCLRHISLFFCYANFQRERKDWTSHAPPFLLLLFPPVRKEIREMMKRRRRKREEASSHPLPPPPLLSLITATSPQIRRKLKDEEKSGRQRINVSHKWEEKTNPLREDARRNRLKRREGEESSSQLFSRMHHGRSNSHLLELQPSRVYANYGIPGILGAKHRLKPGKSTRDFARVSKLEGF